MFAALLTRRTLTSSEYDCPIRAKFATYKCKYQTVEQYRRTPTKPGESERSKGQVQEALQHLRNDTTIIDSTNASERRIRRANGKQVQYSYKVQTQVTGRTIGHTGWIDRRRDTIRVSKNYTIRPSKTQHLGSKYEIEVSFCPLL